MTPLFDVFVQQAWADHADQPVAVAERLRTRTPAPEKPEHLAALARLVVHLYGEHLGEFAEGRRRLAALLTHPLADATVQSALRVSDASLTLAEQGRADVSGFSVDEQVRCEAGAAAISLARGDTARAMALLEGARARVAALAQADASVHRPLAVASNNMAWELHDRAGDRSAADTEAMLDLAAAARVHWLAAGTWQEAERADYLLALCHLSAGRLDDALDHASRCLSACQHNDAPAFELFFAHEALARVRFARGDPAAGARSVDAAEQAFGTLAVDQQHGCQAPLAALRALVR